MASHEGDGQFTRREFLGGSVAGFAAAGFSPYLVQLLEFETGRSRSGSDDLLVPEDVLKRAVEFVMAKGADFGDVFVEKAGLDRVTSNDRKNTTRTTIEQGVGARAVKDGRTFYAYTASFDPQEIYDTVRFVAEAAAQGRGSDATTVVDLTRSVSTLSFPLIPDPASVEVRDKIEELNALAERAWTADERVVQVNQVLREIVRKVNLATSSGRLIDQTLGLTEFYASTYMKDATGNLQNGGDSRAAHAGRDFFTGEHSFETIVDKSIERTSRLLEAVDSPRGTFPVVLGPGGTGVLFHESCGHGMEADLVYKGSNYKDQIGELTAARGVTLIDDGTIPEMPGSYAFDDEGTPSQKTVLIEDGIQQNYMSDLVWAEKLGIEPTGSGRRESFRYPPIPRMRNTYIDSGDMSPEEIIASTKRGLYVVQAGGGQVDVITGNFMMGVTEGYLIEDGEITSPVKGATLSGMGVEAMRTIDMLGNDLVIFAGAGRCGKGQAVPTGFGMPTIRIRGIVVGGPGEAWRDQEGGIS